MFQSHDLNNTSRHETYSDYESKRKTVFSTVENLLTTVSGSTLEHDTYFKEQLKRLEQLNHEYEKAMGELYYCDEFTPDAYAKHVDEFASVVAEVRSVIINKIEKINAANPSEEMENCLSELQSLEAYVGKVSTADPDSHEAVNVLKKQIRKLENLEITFKSAFSALLSQKKDRKQFAVEKQGVDLRLLAISNFLESRLETEETRQRLLRRAYKNEDDEETLNNNADELVKLPRPTLPTFDGSVENWANFRESFERLVHQQKKIPKIQKFNLLKEHYKPPGKKNILSEFTVSEAMYETAWESVKKRHNKVFELRNFYIESFLSVKAMQFSTSAEIDRIRDTFAAYIANLTSIKMTWEQFIVYTVEKSLDQSTAKDWASFLGKQTPTWAIMQDFLEEQSTQLSSISKQSHSSSSAARNAHKVFAASDIAEQLCICCKKEPHRLFECSRFKDEMSSASRLEFVKSHQLCYNCLSAGHAIRDCKSKSSCRKCSKVNKTSYHHTLLHKAETRQSYHGQGSDSDSDSDSSVKSKKLQKFQPYQKSAPKEHVQALHAYTNPGDTFIRYRNTQGQPSPSCRALNDTNMATPITRVPIHYKGLIHNDKPVSFIAQSERPLSPQSPPKRFAKLENIASVQHEIQSMKSTLNMMEGYLKTLLSNRYDQHFTLQ